MEDWLETVDSVEVQELVLVQVLEFVDCVLIVDSDDFVEDWLEVDEIVEQLELQLEVIRVVLVLVDDWLEIVDAVVVSVVLLVDVQLVLDSDDWLEPVDIVELQVDVQDVVCVVVQVLDIVV
ncbi:MAG: hypothetical protein ACFFDY_01280 [Candidatus Thorarchaeota archaeon]